MISTILGCADAPATHSNGTFKQKYLIRDDLKQLHSQTISAMEDHNPSPSYRYCNSWPLEDHSLV